MFTTYGDDCNARFQVGYGFAPNPAMEGKDKPCKHDLHARLVLAQGQSHSLGRSSFALVHNIH